MPDFRIAFVRPDDGGVSIVYPAPGVTLEQCLPSVPVAEYKVLTDGDIPPDRDFRNAWVLSGARVDTDIAKAKDIAHERRRLARAEEMAPLDVRATIPKEAAAAEAEREALRVKYAALQVQIDAARSVEQLKSVLQTVS